MGAKEGGEAANWGHGPLALPLTPPLVEVVGREVMRSEILRQQALSEVRMKWNLTVAEGGTI